MSISGIIETDATFQQIFRKDGLHLIADLEGTSDIEDAVVGQSVAANLPRLVLPEILLTIGTEMTGRHILDVRQIVNGAPNGIILIGYDIAWQRIGLCRQQQRIKQSSNNSNRLLHSLLVLNE